VIDDLVRVVCLQAVFKNRQAQGVFDILCSTDLANRRAMIRDRNLGCQEDTTISSEPL
jgi:hypothetical protein